MFDFLYVANWVKPVLLLTCGLLAGIIAEKIILRRLRKWASATKWDADNIIADSFRGMPLLWLFLAGAYGAVLAAPTTVRQDQILEKILLILVILSLTVVAGRIGATLVSTYSRKQEGLFPAATIFSHLVRMLILSLGLLTIFHALGINITPALTALGVGGLAVALALQDTLSNFFSGLQLIVSGQINPGDFIRLASGEQGYVTDITWRNTTLRTLPNNLVIVPNSQLATQVFTNYHQPGKEMAVLVQVGVSYGSDLKNVESVTIEVATEVMKEVTGAIPEFQPFIRYHTFGDFSIQFSVIMRGREFTDQYLIKHEFVKRLQERYIAEKIDIPFPIRTVYMRQEN